MYDFFYTVPFLVIAAFVLDIIAGDPQWSYHPVRLIGKSIAGMEYILLKLPFTKRILGVLLLLFIAGGTFLISGSILSLTRQIHPLCKAIAGLLIIYFTISVKGLADETKEVIVSLENNDIEDARRKLSRIVGRDTKHLNKEQIVRACLETVAEGCVDGILSPLFYCFIGGPAAGMTYRAVNTLDSMVGYKNVKYAKLGWASARLDDIANYIPARLAGIFIPMASFICGYSFMESLRTVLQDGKKHESPNSGLPEAAFAGALGVQLGGPSTYHGELVKKPYIGIEKEQLTLELLEKGIRLMYTTSILFLICGFGVATCINFLYSIF